MPTGLGGEQMWLSATNDNTGTSTAFDDQSGNGNNGTAYGTTVVADTSNGGTYAYDFDGVNDYIDLGNILGGVSEISLNCWVKPDDGDAYQHFIQKRYVSGDEPFVLKVRNQNDKLAVESTSGSGTQLAVTSGLSPLPDGQWSHLCGQLNGDTYELYINGVLTATSSYSPAELGDNSGTVSIGVGRGSGFTGYTAGSMDDVRIYDRALTQAEVTHLATSRGITGSPGGTATNYSPFRNAKYINKTYQIPRFG